jgi:fused-like protein
MAAERLLGEGAFGKVFLYQYESSGERVAVKFINDEEDLGNDITRLQVLSRDPVCSKYVVCYMGHAKVPNPTAKIPKELYAIKTSYVEGPALDSIEIEVVEKNRVVAKLLASALKALRYVHSNDIVHGDLKPENILVRAGTHSITLIDFGLACKPPCVAESVGSPDYMAPEQLEPQNAARSKAADRFSLGASFFFVVLGKNKETREAELKRFDSKHSRTPFPFIPWTRDGVAADRTEHAASLELIDFYTNTVEHRYGRVLKQLLSWSPEDRPSAKDALSLL